MSTQTKKVHFEEGLSLSEPSFSSEAVETSYSGALSPLKSSTVLGSTIKKLSPISGVAQTEEAKNAYNRLLQVYN